MSFVSWCLLLVVCCPSFVMCRWLLALGCVFVVSWFGFVGVRCLCLRVGCLFVCCVLCVVSFLRVGVFVRCARFVVVGRLFGLKRCFLVGGWWLLVICCWLMVVGCKLLVVGNSSLVVGSL